MDSIWAFSTWAAFFAMDGHGLYVWSSYGTSAILLILLISATYAHFSRWKKNEIKRLERMQLQRVHQQKEV